MFFMQLMIMQYLNFPKFFFGYNWFSPISPSFLILYSFFFFFLLVIFLFILFFNFTILYWFCHISTWIHHRYTHIPHPEPSSLLPPHTSPLSHPSAPAPSKLQVWWWTRIPGVLLSMGWQRVRPDWATEWSWINWLHFNNFWSARNQYPKQHTSYGGQK